MAVVIIMIKTVTQMKASATKQQPNLQKSLKKKQNKGQENGWKSQQEINWMSDTKREVWRRTYQYE